MKKLARKYEYEIALILDYERLTRKEICTVRYGY